MRSLVLSAGFVLSTVLLGCGGKSNPYPTSNVSVSGRLLAPTGEPVRGGAGIALTPAAKDGAIFGKAASGVVGSDGAFTFKTADGADGVPGGFYTVTVYPHGSDAAAKGAATRIIPRKLWSDETSDMTVEISEAKSGWDLKLSK